MLTTQTLTWGLALLASTSAAPTADLEPRQAACKDVHIFLAKGNNEPYPGRQGKLAGSICYGLDSCDYEDILYDNELGVDYCKGVTQGKRNGLRQMRAYANRCPNSKLVISGYSQGANVVGDMLGGGQGKFGDQECFIQHSVALDPTTSPGNKIGAALLFGDTRHVKDQSYNVEWLNGTAYSAGNPRFPRSLERMNKFSNVLRSYCDAADPVCAEKGPGPFWVENHLNYFDRYSDDAGGWTKWKLGY